GPPVPVLVEGVLHPHRRTGALVEEAVAEREVALPMAAHPPRGDERVTGPHPRDRLTLERLRLPLERGAGDDIGPPGVLRGERVVRGGEHHRGVLAAVPRTDLPS